MKLTNMVIMGVVLIVSLSIPLDIKHNKIRETEKLKRRYDVILSAAVEDAANMLAVVENKMHLDTVSEGNIDKVNPNLDLVLQQFYHTLYMNMGIRQNDEAYKEMIKRHVPIKLIIADDRYYINTLSEIKNEITGKTQLKEVWYEKAYTYYHEDTKLIVNFTLSDNLKVFDVVKGIWREGNREDMNTKYPSCSIFDIRNFESFKKQVIIENIQKDLQYYTSINNKIALKYGFGYIFNIPSIDTNKQNTIDTIGFTAFLQGMPINNDEGYYDTYAFSGTEISNKKKFYGRIINGVKYYYSENSSLRTGGSEEIIFDSALDAAKKGYYPLE